MPPETEGGMRTAAGRRIFRIEHPSNRKGPYTFRVGGQRNGAPLTLLRTRHSPAHRPPPERDPILMDDPGFVLYRSAYVFAYLAPEHIFAWFDTEEERRLLGEAGFQVREYEVNPQGWGVVVGQTQVAFRRKAVRKVRSWSLAEFEREFRPSSQISV